MGDGECVGRRYEFSDVEREARSRYLPSAVNGGRPPGGDRRVLNSIVWKIRGGVAGRARPLRIVAVDLRRFRRFALDGTVERMHAGVQAAADAAGDFDWLVLVDSTIV